MSKSVYIIVGSVTCDAHPSESYVVDVSKLVRHFQTRSRKLKTDTDQITVTVTEMIVVALSVCFRLSSSPS